MLDKYLTFVTVAESNSYTEVARKLFCSQPTVTQHVQQLEQHYNCKLVRRQKRVIELTAQGQLLAQTARQILQLEQGLMDRLQAIEVKTQPMPLYISHYLAETFFNILFSCPIASNCATSPYDLYSLPYKELKTALLNDEAKFALMPLYEEDEAIINQFDWEVLFEEELQLIVSKGHRLASRKQIYLRDLAEEQILLPQSFFYQQIVKKALDSERINYLLMTNFGLIEKAVEQNMGIAFIPAPLKGEQNTQLVYKQVSGLKLARKNAIVRNRSLALNEVEQFFCENIKKQFA